MQLLPHPFEQHFMFCSWFWLLHWKSVSHSFTQLPTKPGGIGGHTPGRAYVLV